MVMVSVSDVFYISRPRIGLFKFIDNRNNNEQGDAKSKDAHNKVNSCETVAGHLFFYIAHELVHCGSLCAKRQKEQ